MSTARDRVVNPEAPMSIPISIWVPLLGLAWVFGIFPRGLDSGSDTSTCGLIAWRNQWSIWRPSCSQRS